MRVHHAVAEGGVNCAKKRGDRNGETSLKNFTCREYIKPFLYIFPSFFYSSGEKLGYGVVNLDFFLSFFPFYWLCLNLYFSSHLYSS